MVAQSDKAQLWQTIREHHPELARALKARQASSDDQIEIDCYPNKTNRWLMDALRRENPELAVLLNDTVFPDKELLGQFCKPTVSVALSDLISALLAFECRAEAA